MSVAWYDIQQNTFTRWVNDEIRLRGMRIDDMKTELKDGLVLINLMEIISGKSLGRYNKHPVIIQQKLENLNIALRFIKAEGLKLVNIGAEDIVNGNMVCILGLIWTIILRYEINRNGDNDLLRWIQSKIPEYNIKNFTRNWNDGRALNGLINALRPDLCQDHKSLDKKDKLANATRGIDTADREMGVDKLVLPEEMTHKKVDKRAMMTYLAQFRNLKPPSDAYRVRAYGDGLHKGIQGNNAPFFIEKPNDAKGTLDIKVVDQDGKSVAVDTKRAASAPKGCEKLACSYVPKKAGVYKIHITLDGKHVPGSIFTVVIDEDLSIGGEGKILCFFSTTSGAQKQRSDIQKCKMLFESKKIHLREDFVPWVAVDLMDRPDREAVFQKAGTRALPIIIIDDKYLGTFDKIMELEENGKLDGVLKMDKQKYVSAAEHKRRLQTFVPGGEGRVDQAAAPAGAAKPAPPAAKPAAAPAGKPAPKFPFGTKFNPNTGEKISKFDLETGAMNW